MCGNGVVFDFGVDFFRDDVFDLGGVVDSENGDGNDVIFDVGVNLFNDTVFDLGRVADGENGGEDRVVALVIVGTIGLGVFALVAVGVVALVVAVALEGVVDDVVFGVVEEEEEEEEDFIFGVDKDDDGCTMSILSHMHRASGVLLYAHSLYGS